MGFVSFSTFFGDVLTCSCLSLRGGTSVCVSSPTDLSLDERGDDGNLVKDSLFGVVFLDLFKSLLAGDDFLVGVTDFLGEVLFLNEVGVLSRERVHIWSVGVLAGSTFSLTGVDSAEETQEQRTGLAGCLTCDVATGVFFGVVCFREMVPRGCCPSEFDCAEPSEYERNW